jgi:hypothetical protein
MVTVQLIFAILALVFYLLAGFRVAAAVDWTNLGHASVVVCVLLASHIH